MKNILRECVVILLSAIVLLIPYEMGKYEALNGDMNVLLFIVLGAITLMIAEYKSRLSRKNRENS